MPLLFSSLRARALLLLAFALLSTLAITVYHEFREREVRLADARERVRNWVELIVAEQDRVMDYTDRIALNLLQEIRQMISSPDCSGRIGSKLEQLPQFTNLSLVSPEGRVVCSARPFALSSSLAARDCFENVLQTTDRAVCGIESSRAGGVPELNYVRALREEDGRTDGALVIGVDLSWLQQAMVRAKFPAASRIGMIDASGRVVARYPDPEHLVGVSIAGTSIFKKMLERGGNGVAEDTTPLDGGRRIYAFSVLASTADGPVYFFLGIPRESVTEAVDRSFVPDLALLLAPFVLTFAAVWYGSDRWLLRPVAALSDAVGRLAKGDYSARASLKPADHELGRLARAFDDTAQQLERAARDERKAHEQLRKSEQRLRRFYESNLLGVIYWNMRGEITDANDRFLEIVGYTREDLAAGRIDWIKLTPPEFRGLDEASLKELRATGVNRTPFEKEYVRNDGARVPILVVGAMLDEQRIDGVAIVLDISKRKQAEERILQLSETLRSRNAELEGERARWQGVVEGIADEVWLCDREGKMSLINLPDVTAMGLDEFHDKSIVEVLQEVDIFHVDGTPRPAEEAPLLRSLRSGEIVRGEELMRYRRNGKTRYRQFSCAPTRDAKSGLITGAVAILRDITAQKEAEAALRESHAQLAAANRELESFAYSVSHDLRAPLRGIDAFSRTLLEKYTSGMQADALHCLQMILDSAQEMGGLIDDLLAFSRLSYEPPRKEQVRQEDLVRAALKELEPQLSGRQIEFSVGELPQAEADPTLLKQVWINLIGNAVKYTKARERAEICIGSQLQDGAAVYFVQDNGVGFDMRYADKLFQVFRRLHSAEEYEGSGVGLAIVQRIVARHGGRVWVQAMKNQGATFYFTLQGGAADSRE